jgi:hypothetical protein
MDNSYHCEGCHRKLIDRFFDKCMYCGHVIPESMRLSEDDRNIIQAKKDLKYKKEQEEHAEYMEKHRSIMRGHRATGSGDGSGDGGGD